MKAIFEKIKELFEKIFYTKEEALELTEIKEVFQKYPLKVEKLVSFQDVERIARIVREGNLTLVSVKDLQRKDLTEFQNSLIKLKRIANQFKWDLVAIEDGYLIISPGFAVIERK
ncbi:MAG: hypothetical protein RMJ17_03885 [Candidatus Aenigmarchaeota archaeon]|nr:cell division protein SepF [Candidatus Aenigmarchaeota archaeon]MDW8149701.1 hypothetical protein [Candidatus Aenigmarchaeota archaeon]